MKWGKLSVISNFENFCDQTLAKFFRFLATLQLAYGYGYSIQGIYLFVNFGGKRQN